VYEGNKDAIMEFPGRGRYGR